MHLKRSTNPDGRRKWRRRAMQDVAHVAACLWVASSIARAEPPVPQGNVTAHRLQRADGAQPMDGKRPHEFRGVLLTSKADRQCTAWLGWVLHGNSRRNFPRNGVTPLVVDGVMYVSVSGASSTPSTREPVRAFGPLIHTRIDNMGAGEAPTFPPAGLAVYRRKGIRDRPVAV